MGKIFLFLILFLASICTTYAHPLGNFSVNNFSRIEIEKGQIRIRSVLDLAEIPTFQQSLEIDTDRNSTLSEGELAFYLEKLTPEHVQKLKLFVNDQPLQLQTKQKNISILSGSANLPTLRIVWDLVADISSIAKDSSNRLRFENANYSERIGWNEIVVNRVAGINVFDSTAFGNGETDELKEYPKDMLASPLAERKAELSFTDSSAPENAAALLNRNGRISGPIQTDRFAALIAVPEITPTIALVGILIALGLGAMHALSPGHGKTVVGAYLIGSKGTPRHAAFLGLTVTITHTLGVFALGLITLFATQFILPERIMPFLSFISGLLVLFIGLTLFKDRLLAALGYKTGHVHDGHSHDHAGANDHNHGEHEHRHHDPFDGFEHSHDGHTHSHRPPESVTWKSLLALGISGGLLPCPSALVLMLAAINLNRIGYGILLTIAFSIGLAATLMCIGLAFLYMGKIFDRPSLSANPIVKALPVFSAFVVTCLGAVICYNSLV
ncbi:MAG: sulfite exporter TauE/SafE family protein [Pyrinomonadaceae bacterium]